MTVGDNILEWMLRRLLQAVPLTADLVLVRESPAIADVGTSINVKAEPWRVVRVTGELTLRDALPEADRLIAIVPPDFPPLPMDITGRTYLSRILEVRADDLVAGVSGRFCEALVDENLAQGVFDSLDTLRTTAGHWSLGELVTAREVRSVLVGAALGAARLDRERDWELLARWILEGAPTFRAPTLVGAALVEAQPRTGGWLAWALTDGSLALLCTAGALLASPAGAALAPAIPGVAAAEHSQVVELVDAALREVWRRSPARARETLIEAERAARQVPLEADRHRLLRLPLEGVLTQMANDAANGRPPDDIEIEKLKRNMHAADLNDSVEVVAALARLGRFQRLVAPPDDAPYAWFRHALQDVAWADLAYRRVRRRLDALPAWLGDPAGRVLADWVSRRDVLNARFAETLAKHWASLARSSDATKPLALHQLTRCVVRRLVDDGSRVFLLVLDGCDLASFLEILDAIPAERGIGLALPEVHDAVLRDDLSAMNAFGVAISPLPTVTSHSRRALFAGEIPGNAALDDTESAVANATADQIAWKRNSALGDTPRRLFLKGDLGGAAQPLLDALQGKDLRVVAAVLNGVDDALSSKETTTLPCWSLGALGSGAAEVVQAAIAEGWCVLVTADHGHTPFVAPERKAAPSGLGQRFSAEAVPGAVAFRNGPLPRQPLHLLTRFGGWVGPQSRGFHGGASLEEVAVPLAFLGRVRGAQEGRPSAPSWWWSADEALRVEPPRVDPARAEVPRAVASAPSLNLNPKLESLTDEEKRAVALLQQNQSVRLSALAQHFKKPPNRASGFMHQLIRKLFELNYPCITFEVLSDNDRLYRYQAVDEGAP
ncbi:MAG TPA: BREX-2 system phosphatase PglZ [Polyangiaceae bacterium]